MKKTFKLFFFICAVLIVPGLCQAATIIATSNPIYRFFNTTTGTHFYSSSLEETNSVLNTLPKFNYEGVAFSGASATNAAGVSSVYRFFNSATGTHFYTISKTEKDYILSKFPNFSFEGESYSAHTTKSSGTKALHRFYNTKTGTHFYTASDVEKTNVQNTLPQYKYEGIAYYVETPSCNLSISPTSGSFASRAGTSIISVTATTSSCAWTAFETLSWVSLSSRSGAGSGAISITVDANTGVGRGGSIIIAGNVYKISQAAAISCTLSISPASGSFVSSGGTSIISVTATSSSCAWTASESLSWVSLSSASGAGSGAISITVDANTGAARSGSIIIAGKTYTISQSALSQGDTSVTSISQKIVGAWRGSMSNNASWGTRYDLWFNDSNCELIFYKSGDWEASPRESWANRYGYWGKALYYQGTYYVTGNEVIDTNRRFKMTLSDSTTLTEGLDGFFGAEYSHYSHFVLKKK